MNRVKTATLPSTMILFMIMLIAVSPSFGQVMDSEGYASWYNRGAHGNLTANGESYDHMAMTAAHPSFPFDSMVRVTRLDNGRTVVVRINDRMESGPGHVIDLSGAAAAKLGLLDVNVAKVSLEVEHAEDLLQIQQRLAQKYAPVPQPAPVVEMPLVAEAVASSRYTLQLGVFSSRAAASTFAGELESGWVEQISDSGDTLFRVYYDRYPNEQPARQAQQQLKESGYDSFLREISP